MTTVVEDDMGTEVEGTLTDTARGALWCSWDAHQKDRRALDRVRAYAKGKAGIPDLEDGATEELEQIARQSVINMIRVVIDTFDAGLQMVGFRSPSAEDDDPAWAIWQASGMDSRQSVVHRAALTYGDAYVSILPDDEKAGGKPRMVAWSPRFVRAEYDDPARDLFPQTAMLVRKVVDPKLGRGWSVLLLDDTTVTPGFIARRKGSVKREHVEITGDPWEHGGTYNDEPVCPLIRFVNVQSIDDDDDDVEGGEVEPLIHKQRALNGVNFDRLVNSRFNAFMQTVIIGWSASKAEVAKTSASKALSFDDHPSDLSVSRLPASPMAPYNELIKEMKEEFALEASIPLYTATGSISNVSTDTAALVEKAHQRKLRRKRASFGESWELALRLAVTMAGGAQPDEAAEVIWEETEARSFAQVVDGIVKLASIPEATAGVPVEEMLDMLPGMSQQRMKSIRDGIVRRRSGGMMAALTAALRAGEQGPPAPAPAATPPAV